MGEEPHGGPGRLPRRARAHAATCRRSRPSSCTASTRATNGARSARSASTSRTCLGSRSACSTSRRRRPARARPVPRVHGRRVPGREPAAAGAARRVARRSRRALRGRRRLPDDLLVHRRLAGAPADVPRRGIPTPRWSGSRRTTAPRPQILAVANALVPTLGGFEKLAASHATGRPEPDGARAARRRGGGRVRGGRGSPARTSRRGVEEMAVLYRINARSEPFEEAFAAAGIPYQVRDGAFLRRPGPRAVLARLRNASRPGRRRGGARRRPTRSGFDARRPSRTTPRRSRARPTSLGCGRSPPSIAMPPATGDVAGFVAELDRAVLHRAERARREPADVSTARRGWSSTRCSCPGCSTGSCRSGRRARAPIPTRSAGCSTSASPGRASTCTSPGRRRPNGAEPVPARRSGSPTPATARREARRASARYR